jgi:quercetin dioxygenase-like cupin family protein
MAVAVYARSALRPGRLVPGRARGLRARSVRLEPGGAVGWHSTGEREELLLGLAGRLALELRPRASGGRLRRLALAADESIFLPAGTWHRVVNRSARAARYLYITGLSAAGARR